MNLKKHPELIPVIEWWEKDGKSTVAILLAVGVALLAWQGWKYHQASVRAATARALVEAYTIEELEDASTKFKSGPSSGIFKIRLAKAYFAAERYQEALALYAEIKLNPPLGFEGIADIGVAQSLEALEKYDEALEKFDECAAKGGYLALTAELGAIRSICQAGDKAKALERVEKVRKALEAGDEIGKARVDAIEDFVKRYVKREKRSIFDAADAAAKGLENEKKEAAPAAPAVK